MAAERPTTQKTITLRTRSGVLYERLPWFKKYANFFSEISADVLTEQKPYRKIGEANQTTVVKGGTNFEEEKNLQFADYALYPAGPVNKNGGVYVPTNVLLSPMSELVPLDEVQKRQSQKDSQLNRKRKRYFKTYYGREFEDGLGYYNTLSTLALPFNVIESTVTTGYNKAVVDRVSGGIEITNIHNEVNGS